MKTALLLLSLIGKYLFFLDHALKNNNKENSVRFWNKRVYL